MNFDTAYEIVGSVPIKLLTAVNSEIKRTLTDGDYNYQDRDLVNKQLSWMRLDFMRPPERQDLVPLYKNIRQVTDYIINKYQLDPLNSVSVSMLKPQQVLDEHTDGRFLHRITNRYLVPLTRSDSCYLYGYINDQKVQWTLEFGKVYRINNAIIHSAVNTENRNRYTLLIDTWEARLKNKFKSHPDLLNALTVLGVNYEFEKRLKIGPKVKK